MGTTKINTIGCIVDAIYRVTKVEYPGGWEEHFTYWEPGMVKSKKNKKGMTETTVNYEYDDLYRLKKKDFPSGTDEEFEYFENSVLKKMKDASGEQQFTLDDASRLTKLVQGPIGFVENTNHYYKVENAWNNENQRTQMKLTIRTLSANTWDYTYHDDGGMYQITCTDFSGTPFAQTYLGDGRLDTISFPNGLSAGDLYKDQEDNKSWKTDKMPYLRKTSVKDGSTTVLSWAYDRDSGGREMATTDKDGKYFPNTLDPLGRSSVESKWDSKTSSTRNYQFAYAFDANGNRISAFADGVVEQFTYGDANQLLTGLGTYTYDHFLNMATRVADTANWTLPYDFESRLIQAFDDYSTEVTDTHTWAADGRRMAASWNNGSENVQFIYDPITGNLIGEFYGDGTTFIQNALYTWGVTLLAQKRGGTVSYYHLDGNGSVRALSNSSKTITDTYSYNAFGEIVSSTGSTVNPFRWLGGAGIYDDGARGSVFGLNNIGSGMYAPVLARQLRRQTQLGTEALIGGLIGADLGFLFDSGKGVGTTSGTITFCEKLCKQLVCPFKKLIGFLCKKWCEGYCRGLGKNIKPSSVIEKICLLKATNWDDCDSCCKDVCAKEYLVGGDFYGACYSSCQQSCTLKF